MPVRHLPLLVVALSFFCTHTFSQDLDAPVISQWVSKKELDASYKYHTVFVYLLNGDMLPDLFTGTNLPKGELKKRGLKKADYPKYLYMNLNLPNPQDATKSISFPLYFIDATNKNSVTYSSQNQGKILDEVPNEAIKEFPLTATCRIKTIKGNKHAEFAQQVLSISHELLKGSLQLSKGFVGLAGIASAVDKGNAFFEKLYQTKEVINEFSVPILTDLSRNPTLTLVSASLQQIKWNFTTKEPDVWAPLVNRDSLRHNDLVTPIQNNAPYILVVRYKSKYYIPDGDKLFVQISDDYIQNRDIKIRANLIGQGYKYDIEHNFITALKNSLSLSKSKTYYSDNKENNKIDYDLSVRISEAYYQVNKIYTEEKSRKGAEFEYFRNNYEKLYQLLIVKLDSLTEKDWPFLKSSTSLVMQHRSGFNLKNETAVSLYEKISTLNNYRILEEQIKKSNQSSTTITSSESYKSSLEALNVLENELYDRVFIQPANMAPSEKKQRLEKLIAEYTLCNSCKGKANTAINETAHRGVKQKRQELKTLKNNYLANSACYDSLSNWTIVAFKEKYPKGDTTVFENEFEKKRYANAKASFNNLILHLSDVLDLAMLDADKVEEEQVTKLLDKYTLTIKDINNDITFFQSMVGLKEITCFKANYAFNN